MLSVKKVLAGRGAVDYYLAQTRHGLADYYLPEPADERASGDRAARSLSAPASSWWGGGADELSLTGEVERGEFVPLYAKGVKPGGGYLGRRFRQPEEAAAAKADALAEAAEIDDPYDRWMARHEIRRTGGRASVAAWDCTFSPVKSVSLLWAAGDPDVQAQVWAAHLTAVDAGLGYLEAHAGYVRAGRNGVRILDTSGLVVARMNEWTSRTGDMQLHTHCLVLNRARTLVDGKWRALDGRALLTARTGAGAIYNRTLEAELTRRLGVGWRDRPDGLRELDGVDDELIETFSSRRRAITTKVAEMAEAYRDRYDIDPPPAVVSAMAQHATLATRPGKRDLAPTEALDAWEATARDRGRQLADLPARVLGRTRPAGPPAAVETLVRAVIDRLAISGRATFTRHDLLRAALDVLPPAGRTPDELQAAAVRLADAVTATRELILATAADPIDVPDELRRSDGTSVYDQPGRHRWTLAATLDRERWLLDVAAEPTGHTVPPPVLDRSVATHGLGGDQAAAVRELLGDDRRIGLLIGPAGAGKTRTLRAVVDAWRQTGSDVVGLTVSQAAAEVLTVEAQVRAENTAKWLHETRRDTWQLPPGALVLVDEASMVATADLVELVDQARRVGGKVLLVGDPAQLAAIHIGGGFDLLADRHGAAQLHEIRRFTEPWERDASLRLRRRDPSALADYAMRNRIHGGTTADVETALFHAWHTDATTVDPDGARRSALMIVATNEQAAVLSERARHTLLANGTVTDGPTVRLRDNVASVGDHIVTRKNDRRLRTSPGGGWVVNGDLWTILAVYPDGAADARRHTDGATITLPADYLADHVHLGYATTVHRAQGVTVDVCHAAIGPDATHQQLYVAATRGRDGNHLWVTLDADPGTVADPDDLPTPEQLLSRILDRRDPDRISAHQTIQDSLEQMRSLARLGSIFEDAARTATEQWLTHRLTQRGLGGAADDPAWPTLVTRLRQAALDGHDLNTLLDHTLRLHRIDDAHSIAGVLHWRLDRLTDPVPTRRRGPLGSLPPTDGPAIDVARQAGQLMRQRWSEIRAALSTTTDPLPWAPTLGQRPDDPSEASAWLTAATAVTAYRERYEVPDHTPDLGPRPGSLRPDGQAAWDHARHQADHYLARQLRHLDDADLQELDARQKAIIDNPPWFDPAAPQTRPAMQGGFQPDLGEPWNAETDPREPLAAPSFEQLATARHDWGEAVDTARMARRLIALEQGRRRPLQRRTIAGRPQRR